MEVTEESEPPKRVKTQEILDPQEEDRISLLPDYLIIDEILSRLPYTKEAIRTGTLSKRWLHLWPSVSTLKFTDYDMKKYRNISFFDNKPLPDFYVSVDKTLTQCRHRGQLKKFSVSASYDIQFKSHVNNWIRFATSSKVQRLKLYLTYVEDDDQFVLEDDSFFVNSHFTHLDLGYCLFDPVWLISWNKLTRLTISNTELDENVIENILSGSPLLDTLTLVRCCGFSLLDITSKSVKNLVFCGYYPHEDQEDLDDIIEINAPFISSLTINGSLLLWKLLLLDVSSLVKVDLDYTKLGHDEMTRKEEREDMLRRFILRLPHVKELKIGINCLTAFSRLKAKGFSFPSNLKVVEVGYPVYDTDDSTEPGDCSDNDSSVGDSSGSELVESVDSEEGILDDGPGGDEVN